MATQVQDSEMPRLWDCGGSWEPGPGVVCRGPGQVMKGQTMAFLRPARIHGFSRTQDSASWGGVSLTRGGGHVCPYCL